MQAGDIVKFAGDYEVTEYEVIHSDEENSGRLWIRTLPQYHDPYMSDNYVVLADGLVKVNG